LREEYRLRVFENGVLGNICERKWEEVAREWTILYNEQVYDLYSSPNIIRIKSRRIRWAGHVACMKRRRGEYTVLVRRSEGKRPRGKTQE